MHFRPGQVYKHGHLLGANQYSALIIRDEEAPLDYPALYIPYAFCMDNGWFAARGANHVDLAEIQLVSVDFAGDDGVPFEYGPIDQFVGYEAPESE